MCSGRTCVGFYAVPCGASIYPNNHELKPICAHFLCTNESHTSGIAGGALQRRSLLRFRCEFPGAYIAPGNLFPGGRMADVRDRLLTLSAAASLTLCLATCVLGCHSQHRMDRFFWAEWVTTPTSTHSRIICLGGRNGNAFASFERVDYSSPRLVQAIKRYNLPGFHGDSLDLSGLGRLGLFADDGQFSFGKTSRTMPMFQSAFWQARCPAWLAAMAFAILPVLQTTRWRRRRHPAGHCRNCGYDLRSTPNRCPECGTAPIANPIAAK